MYNHTKFGGKSSLFALSLALAAFANPAMATQQAEADNTEDNLTATQNAGQNTQDPHGTEDDFHDNHEVIVTAPYVRNLNILAGVSELDGDTLTLDSRGQIGDTLTKLPGVSATSFSPGASRPVIRGFQGPRILVLSDGLSTMDASSTSADHGVTIESLALERVEVLNGPAVLLFGGQAMGGAVNTIDKRIPRKVPTDHFHIDALASYGSAADERNIAASIDIPLSDRLVAHVDGSWRKTDDLRVGGYVLTPALRAEQLEIAAEEREEGHLEEAEEAEELANAKNRLSNSATETYDFGGGLSFIDEGGSMGVSFSYYNNNYGVPSRPGAEHHHEDEDHGDEDHEDEDHEEEHGHGEENVTIGMEQFKVDFRGTLNLSGFFDALKMRMAYSDYEHTEFEGDEIGTRFYNTGLQTRIELSQADRGGWQGATGFQYVYSDFEAIGAEAFVPANTTEQIGVFTLQEWDMDNFELEGALRYDNVQVNAKTKGFARDYNSFSFAAGAAWKPTQDLRFGVNYSHAERAPSAEETLSDGPHIATQAYERGNANFTTEQSDGFEAYLRYDGDIIQASLTGYYTNFDDFIIDVPTDEEEDELPVFQYIQNDAEYYGFEGQISANIADFGETQFFADVLADYTHATLDGLGAVPRIPPLRILGGVEARSTHYFVRAEVEWTDKQNRVSAFETPTDDHILVNLSASVAPFDGKPNFKILASLNNIFDVDARRAASFTKDFVPLAGRDFRITAKLSY